MKANIDTMLSAYIRDNKEYIIENGGNVANFILLDAESMENGWLWFLSDDEIDEFESFDASQKNVIVNEIKDYVNSNYNYILTDEN